MKAIPFVSVALLAAAASGVAWPANESLAQDLTSVIALMGQPCGEVVSVAHQGDNDNVATCKDGHRYHVYLNADKRVIVDKL